MFKNPFSLKGRITRTEYGLSVISSFVLLLITISFSGDYLHGNFILTLILFGFIWFNLAQASKRCHDINESGIMQFVPFYGFVLLFHEGKSGNNRYGADPRSDAYKQEKVLIPFKNEEPILQLVQESLPFVLFNSILISLTFYFLHDTDFIINISLYAAIVISYLLFLLFTKNKYHSVEARVIYCIMVFIFIRIYSILFLNYSIDFLFLIIELSFIVVGVLLTYFSSKIYKTLKKRQSNE